MNTDVGRDKSPAWIARPTALAPGLICALLLVAGTGPMAQAEHPPEHQSAITGSEQRPAHSDHTPRHGGRFYMAPNGYHHLEGALPQPDRFHLYLYDDHTRPLPAAPFLPGARAWVRRHGTGEGAVSDQVEIRLRPADDGTRLEASIPEGVSLPIEMKLSLKLGPARGDAVFNFDFQAPSVAPIAEHHPNHKR